MMRCLRWLSAVIAVTSVQAFYPYQPPWLAELQAKRTLSSRSDEVVPIVGHDGSPSTVPAAARAIREALRLAKKYNGEHSDLTRRQSNYDVMEAIETGAPATAGIDQDGTDYSYFVEVALGSEGKKFYMLLDTGAGSSWVMGSSCTSEACKLHNKFGPKDSDTFQTVAKTFDVAYGSGSVTGSLAVDTFTLGGMSISYEFGIAKNTSNDFVHFAFDGILGMSMNNGSSQNFMEELKKAGKIEKSVFAVSLHRAADGTNDGEIKFGSPNKDKYKGTISYTDTASANDDWAIELDDAAYDGKSSGVGGVLAYIDTGTTYIFGPKELVKSFHSVIPGAKSSDGMAYKVPCDSNKALTFSFSGVDCEVSPKDWISPKDDKGECTSNIYGQEVVQGSWLLGAAFIKNVYTVFDKEEKRIGFAAHADVASGTEKSSSTSGAPSTATTVVDASGGVTMSVTSTIPPKPSLGLGGQEETTAAEGSSNSEGTDAPTAAGGDAGSDDGNGEGPRSGSPTNVASLQLAASLCIASVFSLLV